jgi:signal transduction histidine kinase
MQRYFTKTNILLISFLLISLLATLFYGSNFVFFEPIAYDIISPSLILSISFIASIIFLNLYYKSFTLYKWKNSNNKIAYFLNLSVVGFIGSLLLFLIKFLYFKSQLTFRVESLLNTNAKDIVWLSVFLSLFLSYFLFSLWVLKLSKNKIPKLGLRVIFILINILLIVCLIVIFEIYIPVVPIMLSYSIFYLVLDLFIEKAQFNSSWLFAFMIVISGLTALILFSSYSELVNEHRIENLKKILYHRDLEFENLLQMAEKKHSQSKDKIIIDYRVTSEKDYLNRLNSGYYKINDSIYFNPLNGDYIVQLSELKNDKINWKLINNINKISAINSYLLQNQIIVLKDNKVLYNNTGFGKLNIRPEDLKSEKVDEFINDGYSFIKFNQDLTTIIEIRSIPGFLRPLSLFSMMFALSGIFVLLVSIINIYFHFLPKEFNLSIWQSNTLKSRIQMSIIGLFILSFISMGVLAFIYIKNISYSFLKDKSEFEIRKICNDIETDGYLKTEKSILSFLEDREKENFLYYYLYNEEGQLINDEVRFCSEFSEVPLVKLNLEKEKKFFKISTNYLKIDNIPGLITTNPINVLGKTYFIASYNINNNLYNAATSNILSNFLNIYVILFLLSGGIAITLANSISLPIERLSEKLNVLNINDKNELIEWKTRDEIGKLIEIYNNTILKLAESKKIISKIERDSAWREMAKQVAHEIKNPLTPLKLNIQYLQNVVKTHPDRANDIVKQISPGLIEQINNLDKIATEFSDFAKMPSARNEKVNLTEIVTAVHDFFRKRDDLSIKLYVPINELFVFADKNHIVSILNNIIKNAIQAIPSEREGLIVIDLYQENTNAVIKISDNGTGIPDEMLDKVFSPNFTTKSSGTGLGLAISTNMIQAFNGKIYFKTKIDDGTSFYVEIPLMRSKNSESNEKIISLDD